MITRAGIVLAACWMCGVCCGAQVNSNYGGISGGFYGAAGKVGGGGGFLGVYKTGRFRQVLNSGAFAEFGILGPGRDGTLDRVFSINYQTTYNLRHDPDEKSPNPGLFYLSGGYSKFFTSGNGLNYGAGLIWRSKGEYSDYSAWRLEYRETFVPGWGRQPGFRIAYELGSD